ncbi:MAG: tol-pal system protein YbgF [Deltaproteobacteria bacterium ADurb.BinA014]|nr:MAG: tol-pal system protein YbgF [Deltaproteobacteria bacterium ADurb.BinA014]
MQNFVCFLLTLLTLTLSGCATTSDLKKVQSSLDQKMEERLADMDTKLSAMKKNVDAFDAMRKGQANATADLTELRDNLNQLRGQVETLKNELVANTKRQEQYFDNILLKINFIENFLEIGGKDLSSENHEANKLINDGAVKNSAKIQEKDQAYSKAYQSFKEGNYSKARTEFQHFLSTYPNSEYSDNAQFWIGECYFFEKKYEQAILEYEKVIKNYPGGSRIAYALLKQGLSFMNLGDKTSSKLLLQQVIKDYPNTNQARIARAKLQEIK